MTSPLSLLAPLAGADPAAPAQSAADDPAAFAAALVAALQLLQAPPKVEKALPGSVCEAERAPESQAPAEGDQQNADSSRPQVGAAGAAAMEVPGAEQTSGPNETLGAGAALLPDAMLRIRREVLAETTGDTGATGRVAPVDLVSDEPAVPELIQSRGSRQKRSEAAQNPQSDGARVVDQTVAGGAPRIGAVSPAGSVQQPAPERARVAESLRVGPATETPQAEATAGGWHAAAQPQPDPSGGVAAPGAGTPRPAQELGSETRSLKPARRDAPASSAPAAATAPADAALTAPSPAAALLAGMPAATAAASRVQPDETRESVHSPPQPPARGSEAPQAMDPDNDAARRAMVENGRLATQLAEALGDVNITEFRVTLGRGRSAGASSVVAEMVEGDGPAAAAAAAPSATRPADLDGPARPGSLLQARPLGGDVARGRSDASAPGTRPVEESRSEPAPLPADVKENRVNARIPLASASVPPEAGLPHSGRAERGTPQPTLPVSRQELPAPTPAEPKDRSAAVDRPRPGDAATSDTTASASMVPPGLTERLTERGDSIGTRGSSEARNLPHDPPGSERPAGVADRVTLQVADADGRQTRIRVSVLGDQVRAVIVPPDAESARQLERRMDDLQAALVRQGFTGSKVSVQQAGQSAIERGGAPAAAFATAGESKGAASPGRDQPADDQRQGRGQREQQQPGDGHRHPNRRSRDQGAEHRRR